VRATVLVRPKEGILDPQGHAVESSLRELGFPVGQARVGRVVDLDVDAATPAEARAAVERMCEQLLANPLIERFDVEVEIGAEAERPAGG
jgi:phosphoribosylformylglycinamidine synthase